MGCIIRKNEIKTPIKYAILDLIKTNTPRKRYGNPIFNAVKYSGKKGFFMNVF